MPVPIPGKGSVTWYIADRYMTPTAKRENMPLLVAARLGLGSRDTWLQYTEAMRALAAVQQSLIFASVELLSIPSMLPCWLDHIVSDAVGQIDAVRPHSGHMKSITRRQYLPFNRVFASGCG